MWKTPPPQKPTQQSDTPPLAPNVGGFIKVFLPGESPWAEVLKINGPLVMARIANKLFTELSRADQAEFTGQAFGTAAPLPKLHNFKENDEVWFERRGEPAVWQPVDLQ
jgi:hypothetical protein